MPNYKIIAYRHLIKCLSCPIMALYLLTQLDRKISVSLILLSFWKGTPCSLVTSTRFSSAAGGLWLQRWRFFWAILRFTWVGASVMVPLVSRTIEITHLNKSGSCWLFFIYLTIQQIFLEHLLSAKNDDAVLKKTISCLGMLQEELTSSLVVFQGSNNVMKPCPLLSPIFFDSSGLCFSLLIGIILTCHKKTPSKLWKRNSTTGSLPSKRKRGLHPPSHPYLMPNGRIPSRPALA